MARIKTQEDFIAKAKEIYGDRYDYGLVEYVRSSEKVKIICLKHGVFEKSPNKHLRGQGCPVCGRNRTKIGVDEFICRAKKVHGNRYDYSKVVYTRKDEPVEIICPEHGSFWQTPHGHVILGQNCPKCAAIAGGEKRKGDKNVAHRTDVKQKKAQTCLERYGTKTWAESDEGREKLHDIIVNDKLNIMKATCQERYGTDFWAQSDEGRQSLHEIMASEEMRKKVWDGYVTKYGMHYMQTDVGRERARSYIDEDRREKMRTSMLEHLGVPYAPMNPMVVKKSWETKRKNGTFNTSKPELTLHKLLMDMFGDDDIETQYNSDARYPFHCDFYVKSLDLFIELNAHWSHGRHWFDENNEDDLASLASWQEKAKQKGSRYYHAAIDVWTKRDPLKRKTAEQNHLNYAVFWQQDLSDAREYLSNLSRPQ